MFYAFLGLLVVGIVGLDQLVKWIIVDVQKIPPNTVLDEPVFWLFRIAHHQNDGAAWSMLRGQTWFFLLVLVIFIVALVYMLKNKWFTKKAELIALAAILGGALGNAIDRIFRDGGKVVDMIKFNFWIDFPTFNVADIFITLGCAFLVVYVIFFDSEFGAKADKKKEADEAP